MDELLAELGATHELTVETTEHPSGVVAISTCSCVRWGSRTMAPRRDRQQLIEAISRVHRDHAIGASRDLGNADA